jgi:CheY-like chemotaxis protein
MPKLLIVEDDEPSRDMLSRRLERRGYSVVTASDGEQGYSLARTESPDVVLMDISLPGMDGWQVIKLMRAEPSTREIPLILLTAHGLINDRDKAVEFGCAAYYTKPVNVNHLDETIGRVLLEKDRL